MNNSELKNIIKAIFEARYLKRIKRSGTTLLLGNEVEENVVEHSFYVSLWALVIAHLNKSLSLEKLLTMCLIHDLEEVRMGDLNQINRLYVKQEETIQAFDDMWKDSKLGQKLSDLHKERNLAKTPEALAAHDCDILAELITEKEYLDKGNKEAKEWMDFTINRLQTDEGKLLAKQIMASRISEWWEEIKNEIRIKHGIKPVTY